MFLRFGLMSDVRLNTDSGGKNENCDRRLYENIEVSNTFPHAIYFTWKHFTVIQPYLKLSSCNVSRVFMERKLPGSGYKVEGVTLTCRMRHQSEWQSTSSQGWNIPRVTQLSRITNMDMCSNHVQEEVKVKTHRMSFL